MSVKDIVPSIKVNVPPDFLQFIKSLFYLPVYPKVGFFIENTLFRFVLASMYSVVVCVFQTFPSVTKEVFKLNIRLPHS